MNYTFKSQRSIIMMLLCTTGMLLTPYVDVRAQDTLSLGQAMEIALKNNYGIQIAQNTAQIQKNSATKGNAGLLPSVSTSAGVNYLNNNIKLEFAGENPSVSQSGAETWITSASVDATYTIFDGLGSIRNYQNLILGAERSEAEARQTMELVVLSVANTYYTLAQQDENYRIALENLSISKERLERAKSKNAFGVSNKLEVLNAEVNVNTDSVSVLNALVALDNGKRDLNQLLGRSLNTPFEVSRLVSYQTNLLLEELVQESVAKNSNLKVANYNKSIAAMNVKIASSSQYPRLNATASYGYNRNRAEAGFILVNRTLGFTGGLNLSFDLYGGGRKNIQLQNARISEANAEESVKDIQLQVERDLRNAFARYQNDLFVLQVEEKSVETATLNFERTQDQLSYGQLTTTQFREAQLNLSQARTRLSNARYTAKLSEIQLLQLSGRLLTEE